MPHSLRSSSSTSSLSNGSSPPSSPDLSLEDLLPAFQPLTHQPLTLDDGREYVMVIGGLGYIGSHTTLELLKEGFNVIVIDDLSNSFENVITRIEKLALQHRSAHGLMMPVLRFHRLDYRSSAMAHLFPRYAAARSHISGVIHFAAFKSVSESITQPLAYYSNNISGLVSLLTHLQSNGIKNFVFSSSATVYGSKSNLGNPLTEDDLVHSGPENGSLGLTSPYGRSKYFAEAILADLAYADPSMRITALRYFNPVGCHPSGLLREDPRQVPTNLFPVIAQVMTGQKKRLDIFGSDWETRDGTAVRDFIHVVDLARGHIAALVAARGEGKRESFRAFNLGTGRGMTVAECVGSFERAAGKKVPSVLAGRRAGDVGSCVADAGRAERELGWRTEKSVDECAKDTWNALTMGEDEMADY